MPAKSGAGKAPIYELEFDSCRNITSPEDHAAGRKSYSGYAHSSSVLNLLDDENVRDYLVNAEGRAKRSPTQVHLAIRKTLEDHPEDFSIYNGGMVIVARSVDMDDKQKVLRLERPSILNGSQTQGELRRYFERHREEDNFFEPTIRYELIVTDDEDTVAEVSIARNFQNDVLAISIAGRRGQLDDLEAAVQRVLPEANLRKSETDIVTDDGFLDTEKLIQVILALMPDDMAKSLDTGDSKVFTYSQKARCLKVFQRIYDNREAPEAQKAYRFVLDIAGDAWKLYETWKRHPGFKGTRIRSIVRDGREIEEVPDGIVFPIVASLSAFARRSNGHWKIDFPAEFDEAILIETAAQAYMEIAAHNPQSMGKSKACYSTLARVTGIYDKLARKR